MKTKGLRYIGIALLGIGLLTGCGGTAAPVSPAATTGTEPGSADTTAPAPGEATTAYPAPGTTGAEGTSYPAPLCLALR